MIQLLNMLSLLVLLGLSIATTITVPVTSSFADTELSMNKWREYKEQQQQQQHHHHHSINNESKPELYKPAELDLFSRTLLNGKPISASNPPTVGVNAFSIVRPEGERYFFAYVPQLYFDRNQPETMLHITYHGLNDYCVSFAANVGFSHYADQQGFIFVYPCGTIGLLGIAWSAGVCCTEDNVDDLAFSEEFITVVQSVLNINSSAIYVSGYSNGAFMAETLACTRPDLFAAVVSAEGIVEVKPGNQGGINACINLFQSNSESARAISVLNIHGNSDSVVPWNGDFLLGFPPVMDDIQMWTALNGCSNNTVSTFNTGKYWNTIWMDCRAKSTVSALPVNIQLITVQGGKHHWNNDTQFDTSAYIVEWFYNISMGISQY